MPIREEKSRLVDDSRTFSAEDLTEVWAWLDSFDAQPLRRRDGEKLVRSTLTFSQAKYVHREKTYSIARCSDGREVLGSVLEVVTPEKSGPKRISTSLWYEVSKLGAALSKSATFSEEKQHQL